MSSADDVLFDVTDGIMTITLNRPNQRNAMTRSMGLAIAEHLDELDQSDDIAVGIVHGEGGTFCAGMDLKRFADGETASVPGRGFGGVTIEPPRKPLIAAVEGHALAGGFELALACDFLIASRTATFGLPEVRRGLVPRAGGLWRLPQRVPRGVAAELILTGRTLNADRAERLGLVNEVAEPGEALAQARGLAQELQLSAPMAVAAAKEVLAQSAAWGQDEWFERQEPYVVAVMNSDDAKEGALAFLERRPPRWANR